MKKLSFVMSFLIVAGMGNSAFATNGMRMIGFGPVQRSMGGANIASPQDASVVITNPAGMSELKARVDFGSSYFQPNTEYNGTGAAPGVFSKGDGETVESDVKASPIPALGIILPINDKMNFGIGAYGVAGMGVDYERNLYGSNTYSSYSQMRFVPALSYKINQMISAGLSLNLMYATMSFDAGREAMGVMTNPPHMSAASFGYGATIGVLVRPVDMVSAALAYETKSRFQDFEFNTYDTQGTGTYAKDKLEFNQPDSITGGVSVTPIKGLFIVLEVQYIRWSTTNGKDQPEFATNGSNSSAWNLDWEDQFVYKIGLSYNVMPILVVRAGYNYGKMPLNSDRAFENIAFPAITEQHFTFGIGVMTGENTTVNIGFMYSPEASLTGSNAANQYITDYETKMTQYSLDFGISYAF
jgi:long-chain fatty acid transport protein